MSKTEAHPIEGLMQDEAKAAVMRQMLASMLATSQNATRAHGERLKAVWFAEAEAEVKEPNKALRSLKVQAIYHLLMLRIMEDTMKHLSSGTLDLLIQEIEAKVDEETAHHLSGLVPPELAFDGDERDLPEGGANDGRPDDTPDPDTFDESENENPY